MIRVTPADLAAVSPALDRHARGPIFLQANLLRHGLAGTAPRAVHLWRNAGMTAFLGLTVAGVLLPQMHDASPADWASLPDILSGHTVAGLNGDLPQVTGCLANLSLPTARVDRAEPCFALTLTDLRMPDCAGLVLSPPRPQD
ncbi:MAG: hypothetical protein L0G27_11185, partial [Paracoccus sp. (in: a-proteobacteria)]|nr:hypothetical protein [Paracoccus sp. (in: a-proteobacteria)]